MIEEPKYLYEDDSIGEWNNLLKKHGHSRFPVLNRDHEVVGVLTPKDIQEASTGLVRDFMSPKPLIVTQKTTVAYAAHIMAWEGYELLPVVESGRLIGVISRQDVIKAIQHMRNQPQMGENIEMMSSSQTLAASAWKTHAFPP